MTNYEYAIYIIAKYIKFDLNISKLIKYKRLDCSATIGARILKKKKQKLK